MICWKERSSKRDLPPVFYVFIWRLLAPSAGFSCMGSSRFPKASSILSINVRCRVGECQYPSTVLAFGLCFLFAPAATTNSGISDGLFIITVSIRSIHHSSLHFIAYRIYNLPPLPFFHHINPCSRHFGHKDFLPHFQPGEFPYSRQTKRTAALLQSLELRTQSQLPRLANLYQPLPRSEHGISSSLNYGFHRRAQNGESSRRT